MPQLDQTLADMNTNVKSLSQTLFEPKQITPLFATIEQIANLFAKKSKKDEPKYNNSSKYSNFHVPNQVGTSLGQGWDKGSGQGQWPGSEKNEYGDF